MYKPLTVLIAASIGVAILGCDDKPHQYGQERPPLEQVDSEGHGLQSKDLLQATDQMAMELLALPALNQSQTKWTIVATPMENQTVSDRQNLDIFVDRLKTQLYKQGGDRIAIIENRDRFHDIQNRELEPGADAMNQGGSNTVSAGIQPQFALMGTMQELPNRDTSTYRAEFKLLNFKTRELVWNGEYMVKVKR